jgi:hypothetical protein
MNFDLNMHIRFDLTYLLFIKAYELDISCHVMTKNFVYFNYSDSHFSKFKSNGYNCRLVDMGRDDLGMEEPPCQFCLDCEDTMRLEQFRQEMAEVTKQSLTAGYSGLHSLEYTPSLSNTEASDGNDIIQEYLLV